MKPVDGLNDAQRLTNIGELNTRYTTTLKRHVELNTFKKKTHSYIIRGSFQLVQWCLRILIPRALPNSYNTVTLHSLYTRSTTYFSQRTEGEKCS